MFTWDGLQCHLQKTMDFNTYLLIFVCHVPSLNEKENVFPISSHVLRCKVPKFSQQSGHYKSRFLHLPQGIEFSHNYGPGCPPPLPLGKPMTRALHEPNLMQISQNKIFCSLRLHLGWAHVKFDVHV